MRGGKQQVVVMETVRIVTRLTSTLECGRGEKRGEEGRSTTEDVNIHTLRLVNIDLTDAQEKKKYTLK